MTAVVTLLACLAASPGAAQVRAPQLAGYVTLASDYRNRGLSQSNAHAALQLGLDYQHPLGWFAGGWASTVDFETEKALDNPRRIELDLYAGYTWRRADWSATLTVARYAYPSGPPYSDYDEVSAGVGFRDRVFLNVSRSSDFGAREISAVSHELSVALPLAWDVELGATIGHRELGDIPSYTYWNIGLSRSWRRVGIDLRFHDNTYPVTSYLGAASPDQWVLSISYGFLNR